MLIKQSLRTLENKYNDILILTKLKQRNLYNYHEMFFLFLDGKLKHLNINNKIYINLEKTFSINSVLFEFKNFNMLTEIKYILDNHQENSIIVDDEIFMVTFDEFKSLNDLVRFTNFYIKDLLSLVDTNNYLSQLLRPKGRSLKQKR